MLRRNKIRLAASVSAGAATFFSHPGGLNCGRNKIFLQFVHETIFVQEDKVENFCQKNSAAATS